MAKPFQAFVVALLVLVALIRQVVRIQAREQHFVSPLFPIAVRLLLGLKVVFVLA